MATETREVSRETLNIETTAKMLGISRAVAYELARRDQLPVPVIRLGRRMVVSKRALEGVLNARKPDEQHVA
jgi:predicted DNA-binding transcriptional regulator AlpA